jgi:hypothetical protein
VRAHRRSRWRRSQSWARSCRGALAAPAAGVLLALAPGTAAAEPVEGRANDPVGDSLGAPSQDIVGARVQYEAPTGEVTVSATMNGEISSGPRTFFSFVVGTYSPPASCAGVLVSLSGYSTGKGPQTTITGVKAPGAALRFVFGKTISFTTFNETRQLQNKPFSCMTLSVSSSETGNVLDQLDTLLVFNLGSTPPPTPTLTHHAPSISSFSRAVKVKQSKGTGTASASCGLPATETCRFTLTLYATVKNGHAAARVKVGTVTGMVTGGKTGKLVLKLNAAGRRYLRRGSFHVEAKGSARSTAGLVTSFHRRVTIKRTK